MNFKKLLACSVVIAGLGITPIASAEVAVVVHPSNSNTLDTGYIGRIFLGKKKAFPDGSTALPVSQLEASAVTSEFAKKVLGKSKSQLKAYWSKQIFTGKGTPPDQLDSDASILDIVSKNPSSIGFIDSSAVNSSVKVVGTF